MLGHHRHPVRPTEPERHDGGQRGHVRR
jgi:hypothetical protein